LLHPCKCAYCLSQWMPWNGQETSAQCTVPRWQRKVPTRRSQDKHVNRTAPHSLLRATPAHRTWREREHARLLRDAFQLLLTFASERLKLTPSQLTIEQIDAPLVLDFLNDLETTRGNEARSRNTRLAAIRSFMHFLE
jgi:hypothetical protein